jgi:hypothetical protein
VTPVERFRDRRAILVWCFALVWDAAVLLLAAIVRSEAASWKGWLALAMFGLAGAGLSAFALRAAVLRIDVTSSGMTVTRQYPLARRRQAFSIAEVRGATLVEESDGDGSSYHLCRIALRQGTPIDLGAKGRRESAAAEVARFNAALASVGGISPGIPPPSRPRPEPASS